MPKIMEGSEQTFCLVGQIESVSLIRSLQGANIIIFGAFQDLGEGIQVDTQRDRPVATVFGEPCPLKFNGDEGDVRVIHRL